MIHLSNSTLDILEKITRSGHEAFVVGGFVRNALLGLESHDIDICTDCPLAQLEALFGNQTLTVNKSFASIHFQIESESFEITQYRVESDYQDQRHPNSVILANTIYEDVIRRDFTVNALMYHPDEGIVDLVGGIEDLKSRTLRSVGNPDLKFSEDLLRIVRLFRFMSEYGFDVESNTLEAAKRYMPGLALYPKQWAKSELFKMLNGAFFLECTTQYPDCLCTLVPELERARQFNQDNPFHKFNLFDHTVHVIAGVNALDMKIAALFHDLGKLNTRVVVEDRARFPGHAQASLEIAKGYLEAWHISSKRRKFIQDLIIYHDVDLGDSLSELAPFVVRFGYDFTECLVQFKRSDNNAKSEKAQYQLERCRHYRAYLDEIGTLNVRSRKDLKIKGNDINVMGVDAHNRKHVLNHLFEKVLTREIENTRAALIEEVWRVQNGIY